MNYYFDVLKKYAVFSGRASRKEYWMFVLFNMLVGFILGVIERVIGSGSLLYGIYSLGIFLPVLAVQIRRMHDVNKSGWFILVPIYNFILTLTAGTQGDNQYGPDPYASVGPAPVTTPSEPQA
jgi:uncharacterized membrane protein YhaH (DUF805 family)